MGVYAPELTEPLANVLCQLGGNAAFVVHGHGGLDELSTTGPNQVSELRDGQVNTYTLDPATLGFQPCQPEDLLGGDPPENARITRGILDGTVDSAKRDVVLLNAAAAMVASGLAEDLNAGIEMATRSIDSKAALARL